MYKYFHSGVGSMSCQDSGSFEGVRDRVVKHQYEKEVG